MVGTNAVALPALGAAIPVAVDHECLDVEATFMTVGDGERPHEEIGELEGQGLARFFDFDYQISTLLGFLDPASDTMRFLELTDLGEEYSVTGTLLVSHSVYQGVVALPVAQGPSGLVGVEPDAGAGPGTDLLRSALAGKLVAVTTTGDRILGLESLEKPIDAPYANQGKEPLHEVGDETWNPAALALGHFTDNGILNPVSESEAAAQGGKDAIVPILCIVDGVEVEDELSQGTARR